MKFKYILLILVLPFLQNCETSTNDLSFDTTPAIKILNVDKDSLVQFLDSLIIQIEYEDGDGDLGTSDPDINSIFVKDVRLENADEYYLPPLAPEEARVSITGTIDLVLQPTFLLGNGDQEQTKYSIYWLDRAGNQSNLVETGDILIIK